MDHVRKDYEQESARLDADMGDLHAMLDLTKKEMDQFQSRLQEQRDWAQRQLVEVATAAKAAQVDSEQGVGSATKMLHALRDDQVAFREKMSKYVAQLQHATDSHGDAVVTLEALRAQARLDLDALMGRHTAYTEDMDGWAEDARLKMERLFKALEPEKAEWRVRRAAQRMELLRKPMALKSDCFMLKGLPSVQMEFFPHGHQNSSEGQCVLRLLMPAGAKVRYQCSVGTQCSGPREFDANCGALSIDVFFDDWPGELAADASLTISLEMLHDPSSDDTLGRQVLLESL